MYPDLLVATGAAATTILYLHAVGMCVEVVQLVCKAAGGGAVYQKEPLDRCLRDILTANQHVIATARTYEMAGRLLLGLEPLRWLF
jgi:indole-3-acetate monooxygenase